MPIIFLTARSGVRMAVKAMIGAALEFLTKPFKSQAVLSALHHETQRSEAALARECELRTLRADYRLLTPRERELMSLVVSGFLNKQLGGARGISEITVKAHRGKCNCGRCGQPPLLTSSTLQENRALCHR